jgi:hypothetical protein
MLKRFPVKIYHATLSILHLSRVVLSPVEIRNMLSGLPRLQTLHLEACEGVVGDGSAPFTHPSLKMLILSKWIPEACLSELTCPSLTPVAIEWPLGPHPRYRGWGKTLGHFLQRRTGPLSRFALREQWPARLLMNVINNSNTALEFITLTHFASFYASFDGESRVIDIANSSLSTVIVQEEASESQLVEFCKRIRPPKGQVFVVYAPRCKPRNVVSFPWPRLENGPRFHVGFCNPSEVKARIWT